MTTKEAALSSLYIILFSQMTSLLNTLRTGTVPQVRLSYLAVMVAGGILGGMLGSQINRKIKEEWVDRLFIVLMVAIMGINVYNAVRFGGGMVFG